MSVQYVNITKPDINKDPFNVSAQNLTPKTSPAAKPAEGAGAGGGGGDEGGGGDDKPTPPPGGSGGGDDGSSTPSSEDKSKSTCVKITPSKDDKSYTAEKLDNCP